MNRSQNSLEQDIREQIKIPENIKILIDQLNSNLLQGPPCGTFSDEAQEEVKNWYYGLPTYYYDESAGLLTTEPTGPHEDEEDGFVPEEFPEIDGKTIAQALLGYFAPYV